jgi:membrane fusion protein, heavy metal efflux system
MRVLGLIAVVMGCLFLTGCGDNRRTAGEETKEDSSGKSKSAGASAKDGQDKTSAERSEAGAKHEGGGEGHEETGGPVEVSAAAQRRIGLAVSPATVMPLAEVLTLTGTVQPLEGRITTVRPLAPGRIADVVVKVGDRVKRGQVLARFDNVEAGDLSSQYNAARAELGRLKIQQAVTARQAERSRKLATIGAVPQKELEAVEAERQGQEEAIRAQESTIAGLLARLRRFGVTDPAAGVSTTTIQAPFTGVVTAVNASPGAVVDSTSELFSVADLSRVYVAGQVYEKDLGRIRIGQAANVLVASYPDVRFPGRVASLSPSLNPETRTASVRVEVANAAERLRIDMFATVELPLPAAKREALAVQADAIQQVEGKTVVFVRQDATHFAMRPVQVGRRVSDMAEITDGLKSGEAVVTRGSFHLKSAVLGKELAEEE